MMTTMMNPAAGVQVKLPLYVKISNSPFRCVAVGDHRKASRHVACGGGMKSISILPPPTTTRIIKEINGGKGKGKGKPCLDLCFEAKEAAPPVKNLLGFFSRQHLNQMLADAWSHNPLTTLKLIFNFVDMENDDEYKFDKEAFYAAAYWLHQNHPKTLAANIPSIASSSFGNLLGVQEVLFRIRLLQVSKGRQHDPKAAAEYRLLHDRVSDFFARCLKHDIHILSNHLKSKGDGPKPEDDDDDSKYCLELSEAALVCPSKLDNRCIGLYESIASKVFPRESYPEYQGLDEATYSLQVQKRLDDEVVEPLKKIVGEPSGYERDPGYEVIRNNQECSFAKEYLEKLSSSEISLPAGDALLPHEIVEHVADSELGEAAELQWKAMVENIYLQQGLNNCLAVCDPRGWPKLKNASLALTTLVSQLAEEPWKGKVITFNRNPQPLTIDDQGHGDLRSKCSFLNGMDRPDEDLRVIDFHKVFDFILQVAVNKNLKPDQMVKRVFVFTAFCDGDEDEEEEEDGEDGEDEVISMSKKWETHDYEAIKSRFKDNGYDENVVPQLVFWSLAGRRNAPLVPACSTHNGLTILSGFNDHLVKSFLDNHGDIGPDHVMEVAISAQMYQDLVVVD